MCIPAGRKRPSQTLLRPRTTGPEAILGSFTRKSNAQNLCASGVCVQTWHNDNYRTGDNLNETTLTYDFINKDTFGQRCSVALDGQVFGQPLVVTGVDITGAE